VAPLLSFADPSDNRANGLHWAAPGLVPPIDLSLVGYAGGLMSES
jgi:hypothetical protein